MTGRMAGTMPGASVGPSVRLHFFTPSPALQPYLSSFYLTDTVLDPGQTITDWLMPEWAALRMARADVCVAAVGAEPLRPAPLTMVSGPTSLATRVVLETSQIWGVGILPLGWTRLIGAPAGQFADALHDGSKVPALAALAPVRELVFGGPSEPALVAERLNAYFLDLLARRPADDDEQRVRAAHRLLVHEDSGTVSALAERLAMSPRTLERFCLRVFGFSPKLLLRRQRFTRSLAEFLLDPSLKWIATLDHHYVDQAHFVRDFRRFMGMSPSAYSALPHPILSATAHLRASAVGGAVQALHRP